MLNAIPASLVAVLVGVAATQGLLPGTESVGPVLATNGLDYITKSQITAFAKAMDFEASWLVTVDHGVRSFELYAPPAGHDRICRLVQANESLDANVLRIDPASMVDRPFSLPRVSVEVCVGNGWPESLTMSGIHVDRTFDRVRKSPTFRSTAKRYGPPLSAAWGLRCVTGQKADASAPQDVFVLWQNAEKTWRVCLRFQVIDGRLIEAGPVRNWPRSYARGLRNNGDVNWPPRYFDD
jgi:hypothetical protein